MKMRHVWRFGLLSGALAILILAALSSAQASEFVACASGSFTRDDNVAAFAFVLKQPTLIYAQTTSYAGTASYPGGVDFCGNAVPSGGFDPVLSLFDLTTGELLDFNNNNSGDNPSLFTLPADPATGESFDAELADILPPGDYLYTLTEWDNTPPANLYSETFAEEGNGNFTSGLFGNCSKFADVTGACRNSDFALEFFGETVTITPEPATALFLASGLLLIAALFHRLSRRRLMHPAGRCP
jgi:hypothetical protein